MPCVAQELIEPVCCTKPLSMPLPVYENLNRCSNAPLPVKVTNCDPVSLLKPAVRSWPAPLLTSVPLNSTGAAEATDKDSARNAAEKRFFSILGSRNVGGAARISAMGGDVKTKPAARFRLRTSRSFAAQALP